MLLAASLSLSAIATNARVGVGGAYFIISRGLGVEIGGAIGAEDNFPAVGAQFADRLVIECAG